MMWDTVVREGVERSNDASRTALSGGGMAVDGYCRCRDVVAGVADCEDSRMPSTGGQLRGI